jgi:charged multivesicular body protein 4
MWSWFGGAAAQKRKDAPKNAILALREQLDMLRKREKHLENQMAEQEAVAKKNVASNKNGTYCQLLLSQVSETDFRSRQGRSSTEKGPREEL